MGRALAALIVPGCKHALEWHVLPERFGGVIAAAAPDDASAVAWQHAMQHAAKMFHLSALMLLCHLDCDLSSSMPTWF